MTSLEVSLVISIIDFCYLITFFLSFLLKFKLRAALWTTSVALVPGSFQPQVSLLGSDLLGCHCRTVLWPCSYRLFPRYLRWLWYNYSIQINELILTFYVTYLSFEIFFFISALLSSVFGTSHFFVMYDVNLKIKLKWNRIWC